MRINFKNGNLMLILLGMWVMPKAKFKCMIRFENDLNKRKIGKEDRK